MAQLLAYHFGYGAFGPTRRGKRLRPQLVLRIAEAEGGSPEQALPAAVAVEILHNYSLIHDDIEDRDELRHGRATLWARYGIAQALNAGDALCARSFLALAAAVSQLDAAHVLGMIGTLHQAHRVMCDGQALDLSFEDAVHVDLASYERMIAAKTASLFGAACALGAVSAGADERSVAAYEEIGRAFGMAFQIRDDLLGVWGSTDATGKGVAGDIARRKWSFPVAWALAQPACSARSMIEDAYARREPLGDEAVARVVGALEEMGAREAARRALGEHLRPVEAAQSVPVRRFLLGSLDLAVS
ncbi:MAG: polyprenyl synthetase family protein [Vulcanimicrobiaceae bacterium]